jgi:hypothetical protein
MAYYSKERKAIAEPKIKAILKKHGMSGSLSIRNASEAVLSIKSGPIDFGLGEDTNRDVNVYWFHEHYTGDALAFLTEVYAVLNDGNHNNSDPMTDYFDVGWYVSIRIGRWDKPYVLTSKAA